MAVTQTWVPRTTLRRWRVPPRRAWVLIRWPEVCHRLEALVPRLQPPPVASTAASAVLTSSVWATTPRTSSVHLTIPTLRSKVHHPSRHSNTKMMLKTVLLLARLRRMTRRNQKNQRSQRLRPKIRMTLNQMKMTKTRRQARKAPRTATLMIVKTSVVRPSVTRKRRSLARHPNLNARSLEASLLRQ